MQYSTNALTESKGQFKKNHNCPGMFCRKIIRLFPLFRHKTKSPNDFYKAHCNQVGKPVFFYIFFLYYINVDFKYRIVSSHVSVKYQVSDFSETP